jgi:hypothetical protein
MKHQSETKPISANSNRLFFRRRANRLPPKRGAKARNVTIALENGRAGGNGDE